MYVVHLRWASGREEYTLVEAENITEAMFCWSQLKESPALPTRIEVMGPLKGDLTED